ncbi:hypothetical protein OH77DRAFT_1591410 [Trametes cingulata]|nr:hypothetical protein OH77DRAFT_1591410 [Trametes cingulata]
MANRQKTDSCWSLSLRGRALDDGYCSSDDGSDDDEGPPSDRPGNVAVASDDSRLLGELDLASRADAATYKPNPWSIARANAASRPSKPQPTLKSKPPSSTKAAKATVLDLLRKQPQKPRPPKPAVDPPAAAQTLANAFLEDDAHIPSDETLVDDSQLDIVPKAAELDVPCSTQTAHSVSDSRVPARKFDWQYSPPSRHGAATLPSPPARPQGKGTQQDLAATLAKEEHTCNAPHSNASPAAQSYFTPPQQSNVVRPSQVHCVTCPSLLAVGQPASSGLASSNRWYDPPNPDLPGTHIFESEQRSIHDGTPPESSRLGSRTVPITAPHLHASPPRHDPPPALPKREYSPALPPAPAYSPPARTVSGFTQDDEPRPRLRRPRIPRHFDDILPNGEKARTPVHPVPPPSPTKREYSPPLPESPAYTRPPAYHSANMGNEGYAPAPCPSSGRPNALKAIYARMRQPVNPSPAPLAVEPSSKTAPSFATHRSTIPPPAKMQQHFPSASVKPPLNIPRASPSSPPPSPSPPPRVQQTLYATIPTPTPKPKRDAYAAFGSPHAEWSTLPDKKRRTDGKGSAERDVSSGRFKAPRLANALRGRWAQAEAGVGAAGRGGAGAGVGKAGGEERRKVTTYLPPPPKNAPSVTKTRDPCDIADVRSRAKEENQRRADMAPSAFKPFAIRRAAPPSTFLSTYGRSNLDKAEDHSPSRGPANNAQALAASSDVSHDEGTYGTTLQFDSSGLPARYSAVRRRVAQRKRARDEVWDLLGLPSCGVVFRDEWKRPGQRPENDSRQEESSDAAFGSEVKEIVIVCWEGHKSEA